jgi:hypothetical protein
VPAFNRICNALRLGAGIFYLGQLADICGAMTPPEKKQDCRKIAIWIYQKLNFGKVF